MLLAEGDTERQGCKDSQKERALFQCGGDTRYKMDIVGYVDRCR